MKPELSRSNQAAVALGTFRWGCRILLVIRLLVLVQRSHHGLNIDGPPLQVLIWFDAPSVICGFMGKAGFMALATEMVINEVFHFLAFSVVVPLYVAFYQPLSGVELTRWVLIGMTLSTTLRAYLCHIKVMNQLSGTSIVPHIISLLPFCCATFYRFGTDEAIPEETTNTLRICILIHGLNVVIHHHKVVGMEALVVDLLATLADRAILLRTAFDATCDVRVLPVAVTDDASNDKLLAGRLQVMRSSVEMDKLCCSSMSSEILTFQRVTSGLQNLTEIVMRASDATSNPVQNRTMVTIQDGVGFEFDCEVRAVASGHSPNSAVMCGLRQIGEKREVLREEHEGEEAPEDLGLAVPPEVSGRSKASLGEMVMSGLEKFWALLLAEPEREELPSTQVVFRVLRSVSRLLWVECDVSSFEITRASPAALQEFPAPVKGRTLPTLLVSGSTAQKLRKALLQCSDIPRAALVAKGYHSERFGDVALWLSGGPSLPVTVHLLMMPAPTPAQPPVLILVFDKLARTSLRCAAEPSVRSSDAGGGPEAGLFKRQRGGRTLSWADSMSGC